MEIKMTKNKYVYEFAKIILKNKIITTYCLNILNVTI